MQYHKKYHHILIIFTRDYRSSFSISSTTTVLNCGVYFFLLLSYFYRVSSTFALAGRIPAALTGRRTLPRAAALRGRLGGEIRLPLMSEINSVRFSGPFRTFNC